MDKTPEQIEAEIQAAVAAATSDLQNQLADIQGKLDAANAKLDANTVDTAVASATAELQGKLDAKESELGAANARIATFEQEKTDFEGACVAAEKAAEDAAAYLALAADRKAILVGEIKDGGLGWKAEAADERIEALAAYDDSGWTTFLELQREAVASASAAAGNAAPAPAPAPAAFVGATVLSGGAGQAGAEAATAAATTTTAPAATAATEPIEVSSVDVLRNRGTLRKIAR